MTKILGCAVVLFLVVGWTDFSIESTPAADWPQFRGPNSTGISSSKVALPAKFSATENVKWSAEVGDGVGSVVIAAGRTFISAMTGPETVSLFAFETKSGRKLWQRDWATGKLQEVHRTNS